MSAGYLRYPHVHGDEVVFVADDDLWLVPLGGGRATRLTSDRAPAWSPRFSPGGGAIAWTSWAAGAPDVYVLDRATGEVARLTWWGDGVLGAVGWLDEDHVVVASGHQQSYARKTFLYAVGIDADARPLPYGPAMGLALGPGGAVAINTPNNRDSARWKRYRGGTASRVWLDADGSGAWRRVLPDQPAGLYSPAWVGDRLVFTSDLGAGGAGIDDPAAQAQLWSVDPLGSDLRQHTRHTFAEGYVRDAATDGETVVYHARGVLYALESLDSAPRTLHIDLGLGAPRSVALDPQERIEAMVADHRGNGSVVGWRGAAFYLTSRAGPARALSALPGVRVREPQVLGATGRAVYATDAEGEDCLEVMPLAADADPRRIAGGELGRVLHLAASPAGDRVAAISHDGRVSVVDVGSGTVATVGRATEGEAEHLAWSPDGRYLVWRNPVGAEGAYAQLACADTAAAEPTQVALTSGMFDDFSPAFTSDGKHLVFLSSRTFDPVYDEHSFDLAFGRSVRPWLVPLRADEPAPFGPSADGWPLAEVLAARSEDSDTGGGAAKGDTPPPACVLDLDGFEERLVPFPVPSDVYTRLATAKNGVLWLRSPGQTGVLGAARAGVEGEPPADVLERYDMVARRVVVLEDKADAFSVTGDGERVVVRHKKDVHVVPADRKIEDEDDPARVNVDFSRLRREVNPRNEWRQMFDENGRIMRDHFWREDMDGVDWAGVLAAYRPLVERLASADDMMDVLWETVGELNTSHAYVTPPATGGDTNRRVGFLGADLGRTASGETVLERVIAGESSDPAAWAPLRSAGVAAQDGDVVLAVDGRAVADEPALGALLQGTAGKVVELTLRRGDADPRRVAVVPIANEETLRYHDWVASRAAYVDEHSGGRLGYVHVPDMMGVGWAQLHRQIERATQREGVLLDVRYNRGGHTSQLVIERLRRTVIGWDLGRWYSRPGTYPAQAVRGPLVLVCNQWSGSDGDIVNSAAQALGLGPVVGERTWGGVIGIDGRFDLVDGTSITQPRYPSWFQGPGWGVENHGVDPDVEVVLTPADWESSADLQLDEAIRIALRRLEETPAAQAPALPPARFGARR